MKRSSILWPCLYALAVGLVALVHNNADAQPVSWSQADERCAGEPIRRSTGKINPSCRQRDDMSRVLIRQGWLPCAHGVWLSPEQQRHFSAVMARIDGQAAANPYSSDSLMPALLTELRRKLSDAQIFAVWNEQRLAIQAYVPYASTLMQVMMRKLAMTYARSNDPRYTLEP